MQDLKVTLIQTKLYWEDIDRNLEMFSSKIEGIENPGDLILLPEAFSTGFSMMPEQLAEDQSGKAILFLKSMAAKQNCPIAGSIFFRENEKFFNRFICAFPDEQFSYYNKRHLFSLGEEDLQFTPGKQPLIVNIKGWKLNLQVCYDLRFPVFSRNTINPETNNPAYDCLVYVANWPKVRNQAWKSLLVARAIENQCYVVAVNRVGEDGRGVPHSGDSCVIDPFGEIMFTYADNEVVHSATLSADLLQNCRKKLPFLNDADSFEILD